MSSCSVPSSSRASGLATKQSGGEPRLCLTTRRTATRAPRAVLGSCRGFHPGRCRELPLGSCFRRRFLPREVHLPNLLALPLLKLRGEARARHSIVQRHPPPWPAGSASRRHLGAKWSCSAEPPQLRVRGRSRRGSGRSGMVWEACSRDACMLGAQASRLPFPWPLGLTARRCRRSIRASKSTMVTALRGGTTGTAATIHAMVP